MTAIVLASLLAAMTPLAYDQVELTGGPLAAQARAAREFYLGLSEDSLLQGFRQRAGLSAPGEPMGGWYDPDDFAGAHPFGQIVSGLARAYATTHDERYRAKVARLVHGFHQTLGADGYFYASAKAAHDWPCYIYDKNCTAMRDAYTLAGNQEALVVLGKMTTWAEAHLPARADEWYTLAENLYACHKLTGEPRYLALAKRYAHTDFWEPFADGHDNFRPDQHAYSHVNSLVGAAAAYQATGEPHFLATATNAWGFLTGHQMYPSGGWGPNERFIEPGKGALAGSLVATSSHFETVCGSYANLNLDRYLLGFHGDGRYGDNMERVLWNGIAGALPVEPDGRSFYYTDYGHGVAKGYFPKLWPCCAGSYAQVTADYPTHVYFQDAHTLYVNQFVPSRARWKDGITLSQSTRFPERGEVALAVHAPAPAPFTLAIRLPAWAGGKLKASLGGKPVAYTVAKGFARFERTWRPGETLVLDLPMAIRLEPLAPESPERVGVMRGPLMLVALARSDVAFHAATLRALTPDPHDPTTFRTPDGRQAFRPWYLVRGERYTAFPRLL